MTQHRWSGWPGAYCLVCGAEDREEIAYANGAFDFLDNGDVRLHPGYENGPCPNPGSDRRDPHGRVPR